MDWPALLRLNRGVARGSDLCAHGLSRHTLMTRIHNGHWQRVLPDVVIAHSGELSIWDCRRASILYAGPGAVLSHGTAAALHELAPQERIIEVTIPHGRHLRDREFVTVHQSNRPCPAVVIRDLPCTPATRTLVDLATTMRRGDHINALVSRAVQQGRTTVSALAAELDQGPQRGSGLLRRILEDLSAGTRSVGESAFLRLVRAAGLAIPALNAPVRTAGGIFVVDALWSEYRLIVEIDGAAWHLDAVSWQRDLLRQNQLLNAGYRILRFPVQRLREDPGGVIAEIRQALAAAS